MKQIVIDVGIREKKVAVLEENELVELYIEREGDLTITGNIYKGRVVNVLPGMQAAFVDIGLEKNAFLYVKDALPKEVSKDKQLNINSIAIKDVVKSGQEIIVQVVKEPFGTKGARVTTHISIPGRHMVIMEDTDYIGVSKKITDEEDRKRLRNLAKKHKPKDKGIILRTASKGIDEEDFKNDMMFLSSTLEKVDKEKKLGMAPKVIYNELDLVHRVVRDLLSKDVEKIVINNKDIFDSILDLAEVITPELKSRIEIFKDNDDIFNHFRINSMINNALEKKVPLESGGYLVIDETEALTCIDINTGKYVGNLNLRDTVLNLNIEATKEIAKQLRLRNMGGIVIVDFIDMSSKKDEEKVIDALNLELEKDKVQTEIFGMTKLGLLEMARKKVGSRLSEKLLKDCVCCEGTGKVVSDEEVLIDIEKQVIRTVNHTNAKAIIFKVSPYIKSYVEGQNKGYLNKMKKDMGIDLFFLKDSLVDIDKAKIFKIGKLEFIKNILYDEID